MEFQPLHHPLAGTHNDDDQGVPPDIVVHRVLKKIMQFCIIHDSIVPETYGGDPPVRFDRPGAWALAQKNKRIKGPNGLHHHWGRERTPNARPLAEAFRGAHRSQPTPK